MNRDTPVFCVTWQWCDTITVSSSSFGFDWWPLFLGLPTASVSLVFILLYIFTFLLHSLLYLFVSWAWWDCSFTWLTSHCPSVLWHYRLRSVTRKIVSEMTYDVSSGTLTHTILLYYNVSQKRHPFYFLNNSVINYLISIVFGAQNPEETCD